MVNSLFPDAKEEYEKKNKNDYFFIKETEQEIRDKRREKIAWILLIILIGGILIFSFLIYKGYFKDEISTIFAPNITMTCADIPACPVCPSCSNINDCGRINFTCNPIININITSNNYTI